MREKPQDFDGGHLWGALSGVIWGPLGATLAPSRIALGSPWVVPGVCTSGGSSGRSMKQFWPFRAFPWLDLGGD